MYTSNSVNRLDCLTMKRKNEGEFATTFFCRALYDYTPQDNSSLGFAKDEIIEVLTTLSSGWWDGYLREERGWFPSNYVTVISDEEAELVFAAADDSGMDPKEYPSANKQSNGHQTLEPRNGHNSTRSSEAREEPRGNGFYQNDEMHQDSNGVSNDFWVPQVTSDGQVSSKLLVAKSQPLMTLKDLLFEYRYRSRNKRNSARFR